MDTEPSRVIVTTGATRSTDRAFITAISPRSAPKADRPRRPPLIWPTSWHSRLDSALTDWRRETLGQAIADVEAFVNKTN